MPDSFNFVIAFAIPVLILTLAAFLAAILIRSRGKKSGKPDNELIEVEKYIESFSFIPSLRVPGVKEAVNEIVDKIAADNRKFIKNAEKAADDVLKREKTMSTGLDRGVAVPHGISDAVSRLSGAIAIVDNENGIPGYDTIDNAPVRVVVLTISPAGTSSPNLSVLAYIMRRLRERDGLQTLLECKSAAEMKNFFLK